MLFNDTSALVGYFVSSSRDKEKRENRKERKEIERTKGKVIDSGETENQKYALSPPPAVM